MTQPTIDLNAERKRRVLALAPAPKPLPIGTFCAMLRLIRAMGARPRAKRGALCE
jgi:hypothetical protein